MRFQIPFFWQPRSVVSSLEELLLSDDVLRKDDVTQAVAGTTQGGHRLVVVELAGGKVIGDLRLVATRNDVVLGGVQAVFGAEDPSTHYLLKRRRFRLLKKCHGTALLLGAANSDNYYHWMLDSLPRWKMLQAAGWHDYDHVLLHHVPKRFQEETLDWLGVPKAKRLRCSKNFVYQFERLIVPAMPFPVEEVPPWVCAWLRMLPPKESAGPEKVFLSRSGVGNRRLVNEAELRRALESQRFISVQPETLDVAEQAGRLNSARYVVAPHGAALTNMVFAPPGALLMELFHPQHKNQCYVHLAAACRHRYASIDGCSVNRTDSKQLEYVVDVPDVINMVMNAVNQENKRK